MHQLMGLLLLSVISRSTKAYSAEADLRGSRNSSLSVQSRGSISENGCWQIKYYYRNGSYSDVFFYTDFDDTLPTDHNCADGCIYMRLGDNDGSRHCFMESTDELDEVKEEYRIPTANCQASSSRGL